MNALRDRSIQLSIPGKRVPAEVVIRFVEMSIMRHEWKGSLHRVGHVLKRYSIVSHRPSYDINTQTYQGQHLCPDMFMTCVCWNDPT